MAISRNINSSRGYANSGGYSSFNRRPGIFTRLKGWISNKIVDHIMRKNGVYGGGQYQNQYSNSYYNDMYPQYEMQNGQRYGRNDYQRSNIRSNREQDYLPTTEVESTSLMRELSDSVVNRVKYTFSRKARRPFRDLGRVVDENNKTKGWLVVEGLKNQADANLTVELWTGAQFKSMVKRGVVQCFNLDDNGKIYTEGSFEDQFQQKQFQHPLAYGSNHISSDYCFDVDGIDNPNTLNISVCSAYCYGGIASVAKSVSDKVSKQKTDDVLMYLALFSIEPFDAETLEYIQSHIGSGKLSVICSNYILASMRSDSLKALSEAWGTEVGDVNLNSDALTNKNNVFWDPASIPHLSTAYRAMKDDEIRILLYSLYGRGFSDEDNQQTEDDQTEIEEVEKEKDITMDVKPKRVEQSTVTESKRTEQSSTPKSKQVVQVIQPKQMEKSAQPKQAEQHVSQRSQSFSSSKRVNFGTEDTSTVHSSDEANKQSQTTSRRDGNFGSSRRMNFGAEDTTE